MDAQLKVLDERIEILRKDLETMYLTDIGKLIITKRLVEALTEQNKLLKQKSKIS